MQKTAVRPETMLSLKISQLSFLFLSFSDI